MSSQKIVQLLLTGKTHLVSRGFANAGCGLLSPGDLHYGRISQRPRRPGGIHPQPQLQPQPLPGIHAAPRRHRPGEALPRQPHRTHRQLLLGQAHKLGNVPSARARGQAAGPASGHHPPHPRIRPRERGHLHVRGNSLRRCVQEHAQEARPRTPQDGRLPVSIHEKPEGCDEPLENVLPEEEHGPRIGGRVLSEEEFERYEKAEAAFLASLGRYDRRIWDALVATGGNADAASRQTHIPASTILWHFKNPISAAASKAGLGEFFGGAR